MRRQQVAFLETIYSCVIQGGQNYEDVAQDAGPCGDYSTTRPAYQLNDELLVYSHAIRGFSTVPWVSSLEQSSDSARPFFFPGRVFSTIRAASSDSLTAIEEKVRIRIRSFNQYVSLRFLRNQRYRCSYRPPTTAYAPRSMRFLLLSATMPRRMSEI